MFSPRPYPDDDLEEEETALEVAERTMSDHEGLASLLGTTTLNACLGCR